MKNCDEKLKKALVEMAKREDDALEEEIKNSEPHVFSEEFEKKMAKLFEEGIGKGDKDESDDKLDDMIDGDFDDELDADWDDEEDDWMTPEMEEEIRAALLRIMDREMAQLDAEMENMEPHVFSEEFERKMELLMQVRKPSPKRYKVMRYVAAVMVVVLLAGGVFFVGSKNAYASKVGVDIMKWLENSFVVENKAEMDDAEDVLFEESQIGYLPEGFEKVEENISFSSVSYKYQNDAEKYVTLVVYRSKTISGIDNEEIGQEVNLNDAGLEYRFVEKEDANGIVWTDKENIFYSLIGTLEEKEILNIMNGISY